MLFVFEVETRKGRTWANFGEGAGIPGQQTDEEDRETGARDTDQTEHPGAGKEDQPLTARFFNIILLVDKLSKYLIKL